MIASVLSAILFSWSFVISLTQETIESDCFRNLQYVFDSNFLTFSESEQFCEERNLTLVAIPDIETNTFISEFFGQNNLNEKRVFLGMTRENVVVDPLDPKSFSFLDGTNLIAGFAETANVFPWVTTPDNDLVFSGGIQESCVEKESNGLWNDFACINRLSTLCQRSCGIEVDPEEDEVTEILDDIPILKIIAFVCLLSNIVILILLILKLRSTKELFDEACYDLNELTFG